MASLLTSAIKDTAKHSIVYGIGNTLPRLVAIFLLPVFARCLSPMEFGVWAILQSTASISLSLFIIGLDTACLRSYYDYEKIYDKKIVIGTTLILLTTAVLIFNIIGQITAGFFSSLLFKNNSYNNFLRLIIIATTFKIFNTIPYVLFRARKKSKSFVFIQSSFSILRLISMCLSLIVLQGGIIDLLLIDCTISFLTSLILFLIIHNDITIKFKKEEAKKLLIYGFPLLPAKIFYSLIEGADKYLLASSVSLATAGVYSIGMKMSQAISQFLSVPFQLIFPAISFSIDKKNYSNTYYAKILTYFIFVGCFSCLCISLFAHEILLIFGKEQYIAAQFIVPILSLSYLFDGIQKNVQITIFVKRKTVWVPYIVGFGCCLNIFINIIFIKKIGIYGAALSIFITRLYILLTFYFIARSYKKIEYEWLRIIKILFSTISIYGFSFLLNHFSFLIVVIFKSFLLLFFPFILYILKFYTIDEKNLINKYLKIPLKGRSVLRI